MEYFHVESGSARRLLEEVGLSKIFKNWQSFDGGEEGRQSVPTVFKKGIACRLEEQLRSWGWAAGRKAVEP